MCRVALAGVFEMVHGDRAGLGRLIVWGDGRSTGEQQDMQNQVKSKDPPFLQTVADPGLSSAVHPNALRNMSVACSAQVRSCREVFPSPWHVPLRQSTMSTLTAGSPVRVSVSRHPVSAFTRISWHRPTSPRLLCRRCRCQTPCRTPSRACLCWEDPAAAFEHAEAGLRV